MIFADSNVPMYLIGAEHPNKSAARRQLEACVAANERLVTSAGVLQEILHRYVGINRRVANPQLRRGLRPAVRFVRIGS